MEQNAATEALNKNANRIPDSSRSTYEATNVAAQTSEQLKGYADRPLAETGKFRI